VEQQEAASTIQNLRTIVEERDLTVNEL